MKKRTCKIWNFLFICMLVIIALFISIHKMILGAIENFVLLILAVLIAALALLLKDKIKFLRSAVKGVYVIPFVIIMIALFAPILSTIKPDLILNAGECKLLPPLSKKIILYKVDENKIDGQSDKIVADSFAVGHPVKVYTKRKSVELDGTSLLWDENKIKAETIFFPLGTDEFGRDVYSRVIYGARFSLAIGISSALLSFIIAAVLAYISSFRFRFFNRAAERIAAIFLAVPSLFVIIFSISFFGSNVLVLIFILAVTGWMELFKILNGEIKRVVNKDFIVSSYMLKISPKKIFVKEIIPLILPSIIVNLIFQVANFIVVEASLSFLGLGPGGNYISWGGIIVSGINYMPDAWWLILFPSLFLFITILVLNRTGNKLEKYFNPLLK